MKIIDHLKSGLSARRVAKIFSCSPQSVIKLKNKFLKTQSVIDRPKSGRPPATTIHEDRILRRVSLKNRRLTAAEVRREAQLQCKLSIRSIRHRLTKMGLFGRSAAKKPMVSRQNRSLRVQFAQKYSHWTAKEWQRVVFTDESKFNRIQSDGRTFVRRRKNETYAPNCVQHRFQCGGGSVMVWGCVSKFGPGPLVFLNKHLNGEKYCELLNNHFLSYYESKLPLNSIFQQDNAPPHRSQLARSLIADNIIYNLEWPPQSPDLNIIENVWNIMKRHLKNNPSKNLTELRTNIQSQWNSITSACIYKLCKSLPNRLRAIRRSRGYATKY